MTIQQMLNTAADHHRAGRLAQAEHLYRAILAEQPYHADALHLLGVLANQMGHHREASQWINKAIAQRPTAEYYFNLAGALRPQGDHVGAIAALRHAVAMKPNWAGAQANLGTLLQLAGQIDEAIACFDKAISIEPKNPNWRYNLGNALMINHRRAEAVEAFHFALRLNPNDAQILNNLGSALQSMGRFEEAAEKFRCAVRLQPNFAEALNNLGNTLISLSRSEESIGFLRRALAVEPRLLATYNNLGNAFCSLGRFTQAIDAYRQGLALNPAWPESLNNLSIALRCTGDFDGAIAAAEQSLHCSPSFYLARENLAQALHRKGETDRAMEILTELVAERPTDSSPLNALGNLFRNIGRLPEALDCYHRAAQAEPSNFLPACNYLFAAQFYIDDPDQLLTVHRQWNQQYAAPLTSEIRPFASDRDPNRRLRVGYLSPDFRAHCQSLFTLALFPHHDHEQFEIFCYSTSHEADAITARLQKHSDTWRSIASLSDRAAAEQIRMDQIDILIDLTMHMASCRPLILARKPAPIQVCWLAYPGTTGMSAMDYRITDPWLDPPGFDNRYTETSIRLPETFWCYEPRGMETDPSQPLPEANALPAEKNGFITFGCLNDFSKVNTATLSRWGRLMQNIPRSGLHLLAPCGQCRQIVLDYLKSHGIDAERIKFIDRQPRATYLAEYRRIDLCLDTLPYNGHTTSLDAFWMGVPVLTQIGPTVVGRAGFSQLSNLQLPDFAAENDEQFLAFAQRWASDLPALAEIRRTLRERMTASPLMDGKKFARSMEAAFGQMWQNYLAQ